jgi:hypothetical protein
MSQKVTELNSEIKKPILGTNRNNNDVFMIEKANELEDKQSKNYKSHKKSFKKNEFKLSSALLSNRIYQNISKQNIKLDKVSNKNHNHSRISENKTLVKSNEDIVNTTIKNINLSKDLKQKKNTESLFSINNLTNSSNKKEIKNFTYDDYLESNIQISGSLTNKINSFFFNYGNNYNNIEIPFSNFDFSKGLPQEFLKQLNKTDLNYDNLYMKKGNDYPFLNELAKDKFNSLYDDITQDSDFNYFIKEEYRNIHFNKIKSEEVKISNYSEHLYKNRTNQSNANELTNSTFIDINDLNITMDASNNKNFTYKNNSNNFQIPSLKRNDSAHKSDKSDHIFIAKDKSTKKRTIIDSKKFNFTKDLQNKSNYTKNVNSSLQSNQSSNHYNNLTKLNSDSNLLINSTLKSITSTVHFNKYKQDLKKIKDKEQMIKSNETDDNKDSLFKKIQISKELKLKNINKTQNPTINKNTTANIKPIHKLKKKIKVDSEIKNKSNIIK